MEFQRILELKGLKKADQQIILDDFNKVDIALCFRGNATSGSNLPALLLVITNPDTTDGFIASKDVLTREQLLVEELQPLALISSLNLPKQAKTSKMEMQEDYEDIVGRRKVKLERNTPVNKNGNFSSPTRITQ
ncbi:hypothetical protein Bca101_002131 [Brassica carinata]